MISRVIRIGEFLTFEYLFDDGRQATSNERFFKKDGKWIVSINLHSHIIEDSHDWIKLFTEFERKEKLAKLLYE